MDFKDKCIEHFKRDRFAKGVGIRLIDVSPGCAKAELELGPEHMNGADVAQGGAIFTLADLALAAASNSHGNVALSVNSSISFLKAAKSGRLVAEARELSAGGRLASYMVDVFDESGDRVAVMQGMVYRKKDVIPGLSQ